MLFSDAVVSRLREEAPLGLHRWLMVDGAATRPEKMSLALGLSNPGVDLLSQRPCDWAKGASPVLLELPASGVGDREAKRIGETLSRWRYANCFVFIEGKVARERMVEGLHERTDAVLPDGLAVLLRYFDPRVLITLATVMDSAQKRSFLAIADRWWIPDRWGNLCELIAESPVGDAGLFKAPLALSGAQERALIDAGEADAMVDLLLNQRNAQLMRLMPPDQYMRICDALALARNYGIDAVSDQAAFSSIFLEAGRSFVDEEPWREALLAVKRGQGRLVEYLEVLAEDG